MTQSTGRVMVISGLSTITLTLRHWDLSPQATLHLDEARELVRQMIKAIDPKPIGLTMPIDDGEDLI